MPSQLHKLRRAVNRLIDAKIAREFKGSADPADHEEIEAELEAAQRDYEKQEHKVALLLDKARRIQ